MSKGFMINLNGKSWFDLSYEDVIASLKSDINESYFLEFKEDRVNPEKIVKSVCAFANSYGGYLILGVNDDKTIDKGCIEWNEQRVHSTIINSISPIPFFDVKTITKSGIRLIVIRVTEGVEPPYITNKGVIYERVSSGSTQVKTAERISYINAKRLSNFKEIDSKISIPELTDRPPNFFGYIDYGFSLITYDEFHFKKCFNVIDLQPTIDFLRSGKVQYSISKLYDSYIFTVGEPKCDGKSKSPPSGCGYILEIMRDGSVRSRIPLIAPDNHSVELSYLDPLLVHEYFADIYSRLIGLDIEHYFVEAYKFEKLVVLKQFRPVFDPTAYPSMIFNEKFVKRDVEHKQKYGNNLIPLGHRIPSTGYSRIDRCGFDEHNIVFSKNTLISNLFNVNFLDFGFIEKISLL